MLKPSLIFFFIFPKLLKATKRTCRFQMLKKYLFFSFRDISRGFEAVPISCVNGVDNEPCPENFKYIQDNFLNSSLHMDKDITHLQVSRYPLV